MKTRFLTAYQPRHFIKGRPAAVPGMFHSNLNVGPAGVPQNLFRPN